MIDPKRLTDLLALSHVPRWSICDHTRPQSVGDHTFRVLVIATEIAARLGVNFSRQAMMMVLHHDADESRTGDIPTPAKERLDLNIDPRTMCPWMEAYDTTGLEVSIFHLADQIEAYTFINKYAVGPRSREVSSLMWEKVYAMVGDLDNHMHRAMVIEVIDDIVSEAGR